MNTNVYYNPPITATTSSVGQAYVPPPMYQRAKTQEELDRERKDAELAQALSSDQKSPKPFMRDDEEFAKRLVFEESLKTKEQQMVQLLQDEAAAKRLQKEEEALQSIRKRDQERERKDAEEARRLQEEEEVVLRKRRENEERARKDSETARKMQSEEESLRRMVAEEEAEARRRNNQQLADEELALKFQRDEERRVQEEKDKAVARRIQEEDRKASEAEARRIREEERVRQEARRREEERIREEARRTAEAERRRVDQILADADLARRLENQLNIVYVPPYIPPYVPPPPPTPVYTTVNQHTLHIHSEYCGCNKHNHWNNNHITKIHNKYCSCNHPYQGHYTNAGLLHNHGVGCKFYCKYQNHVHTHECCRKSHMHNARCNCSAKFC